MKLYHSMYKDILLKYLKYEINLKQEREGRDICFVDWNINVKNPMTHKYGKKWVKTTNVK